MIQNNKQPKTLLVVEDDEGLQRQLRWCFSDYEVLIAGNRAEAIACIRRHEPYVVTLDLGLPPDPANVSEGFALLEEILSLTPNTKVIVITGNDERESAVRAIDAGAYDFYQKPIEPEILRIIVERAFHLSQLEQENRMFLAKQSISPFDELITASQNMLSVCQKIEKVASTNATTVLIGESGTGKEILANAIHNLSTRNGKQFVVINCAAIPETLLESELFGYEKGAFTGATKQTLGKIEIADNGTLFLDEIGDLPLTLQAKLLRFMQEHVIQRVGGYKEISVNVRVVCATHDDIKDLVQQGSFREDLYYRISEVTIKLPPLRERESDAVLLAKYFLKRYAQETGNKVRGFSKNALSAIESYTWPGNVRELKNKVKRAVIMAESSIITPEELDFDMTQSEKIQLNLREIRDCAEREALTRALSYTNGNIKKTAELLGVSRPTLYTLLDKYDLK